MPSSETPFTSTSLPFQGAAASPAENTHPVYINDRVCIALALTIPPLCIIVLAAIFLYFFHLSNLKGDGRPEANPTQCPPPEPEVSPTSPTDLQQSNWSGVNNVSSILSTEDRFPPMAPGFSTASPSRLPFRVRISPLDRPEHTSTPSHQFRQSVSFPLGGDESTAMESTSSFSSTSRRAMQGSHVSHYLLYPFLSYHTINSPFHPCFNTPTSERDVSPVGPVPQAPMKRRPVLDETFSPHESNTSSLRCLQPRRLFEEEPASSSQHDDFEEDSLSCSPKRNNREMPTQQQQQPTNSLEWDYFQSAEEDRRRPPMLLNKEYWL